MVTRFTTASCLVFFLATSASATTLFFDDFSSYGSETKLNAPSEFFGDRWSVSLGTIDYIAGKGAFGYLCRGEGNCIDLDGSTRSAGLFSTQTFTAGRYTLDLGLFGSLRDTRESVKISLGDWTLDFMDIAADANISGSWTFDTTGGALAFKNVGGDKIGMVLTHVRLSEAPKPLGDGDAPDLLAAPLPAGLLLGLTGLGAMGFAAVRRKRRPE